MRYRILIETDILPISLNKKIRRGGFASSAENRKWSALIYAIAGDKRPKQPLKKCKLTIIRHFDRQLDFDGLVGSMKPVVDALVRLKFIADDSFKVTGQWDVRQEFRPRDQGALLQIWVEEIDDFKPGLSGISQA